jgi:hypothetical protein
MIVKKRLSNTSQRVNGNLFLYQILCQMASSGAEDLLQHTTFFASNSGEKLEFEELFIGRLMHRKWLDKTGNMIILFNLVHLKGNKAAT